ncbi:MAG TPA: HAMP domain-containing protein [Actinoallomurus sp.]|nr:HAMP domain-containing protein [Actinoallomurus sp.]
MAGTPGRVIPQHEAIDDLRRELLTALPIVFVIATIGAYLLATATLRPVERMRAQAAAVTEDTPDRRLDVPPSRDEIARLAATLNDMLDRLQAALDRERQFIADAGHELRTPLSMLHAEIELALRHPRDATDLRAALVSAQEETVGLVRLTEDLLLPARTDRHDQHVRDEGQVRVAPLLHRVTDRLSKRHRVTDTKLVFCTRTGGPLDAGNVRRSFRAITRKAKIEEDWTSPRTTSLLREHHE